MTTSLQAPAWYRRVLTDDHCPVFAFNPNDSDRRPYLHALQPRWQPVKGRHPAQGGEMLIAEALDELGIAAFYEALAFPYRSRSQRHWIRDVVPDFYVPSLHCIFEETSGRGGSGLRSKAYHLRRVAVTHCIPSVLLSNERLRLLRRDSSYLLEFHEETVRRQWQEWWTAA